MELVIKVELWENGKILDTRKIQSKTEYEEKLTVYVENTYSGQLLVLMTREVSAWLQVVPAGTKLTPGSEYYLATYNDWGEYYTDRVGAIIHRLYDYRENVAGANRIVFKIKPEFKVAFFKELFSAIKRARERVSYSFRNAHQRGLGRELRGLDSAERYLREILIQQEVK